MYQRGRDDGFFECALSAVQANIVPSLEFFSDKLQEAKRKLDDEEEEDEEEDK